MAYEYTVRDSHGTHEPLIEFPDVREPKPFLAAIAPILRDLDARPVAKLDIWVNDEKVYLWDCPAGGFEMSFSIWNMVFIHQRGRSDVIAQLDAALAKNESFTKSAPGTAGK